MSHPSFLNNVETDLLKLIGANDILKQYHWETWDSDKKVTLPRGYIELGWRVSVELSPLRQVDIEITLEGRPKKQKLSAVSYELESLMCDDALCSTNLPAVTEAVQYYDSAAEDTEVQRRIEGDLRKLILICRIFAAPTV
jgi:hypothetical protein